MSVAQHARMTDAQMPDGLRDRTPFGDTAAGIVIRIAQGDVRLYGSDSVGSTAKDPQVKSLT